MLLTRTVSLSRHIIGRDPLIRRSSISSINNPRKSPETPEKVRDSSLNTSLQVTPVRETRAEECRNCGAEMSPVHQCNETEDVSEPETVPECVHIHTRTLVMMKIPCGVMIYTQGAGVTKKCETPCDEEKKCNCHNENCLLFRKMLLREALEQDWSAIQNIFNPRSVGKTGFAYSCPVNSMW